MKRKSKVILSVVTAVSILGAGSAFAGNLTPQENYDQLKQQVTQLEKELDQIPLDNPEARDKVGMQMKEIELDKGKLKEQLPPTDEDAEIALSTALAIFGTTQMGPPDGHTKEQAKEKLEKLEKLEEKNKKQKMKPEDLIAEVEKIKAEK